MGRFVTLPSAQIVAALRETDRQYLVGNLGRPQALPHVHDQRLEIGLTEYRSASSELPHHHTEATEYQYVLSGWTQYLDVDTGETHEFRGGDFYAIFPGTTYAQKSKGGTAILFVKVPSVDDKVVNAPEEDVERWLGEVLRTVRTDYWHDAAAPGATSVRPAVAVAVFDADGRVLLLRRADSGNWTLPGGTMEMDESLVECARREVAEECGLDVRIESLVGTYTDPDVRVEYSDGEVRREFTIVLAGSAPVGDIELDDESLDARWVDLDAIDGLELADSQRRRLVDVRDHRLTGVAQLR